MTLVSAANYAFLVLSLGLSVAAQATIPPEMAKAATKITGMNYYNAERCGAPSALLAVYKEKRRQLYSAAGPEFEELFAAGQQAEKAVWDQFITALGIEKTRTEICSAGEGVIKEVEADVARGR